MPQTATPPAWRGHGSTPGAPHIPLHSPPLPRPSPFRVARVSLAPHPPLHRTRSHPPAPFLLRWHAMDNLEAGVTASSLAADAGALATATGRWTTCPSFRLSWSF